ncbi:MAG: hydrogenase expression/formation protein HypE [Desulfobulbaceae bacterium]|jgi:hydrogenase expression/formation protein HypE|nr:hydrogenase expression/formation protein HypE [Desulfobulbaceae bacterium]
MNNDNIITLDHGGGGQASRELVELLLKHVPGQGGQCLQDAAVLAAPGPGQRLVFSTDSYIVDPIFFPGGDIGALAAHGTINDLAMRGARPIALSLAMILEEGLPLADLERIAKSIGEASARAAVPIVTGDTKVAPRGKVDKIFINTAGIGLIDASVDIGADKAQAGDVVLISGTIGDHGVTIMGGRAGIALRGDLRSDTTALHYFVARLIAAFPGAIHTLRDPTRGGVATALHELAEASDLAIEVEEESLPIRPSVRSACALLGLDPLWLANEGKCLIICQSDKAAAILTEMRLMPEGRDAALIGRAKPYQSSRVTLRTLLGGGRILSPLRGQPLPRIC